jgi:hypothetical protein
MAVLQPRQCPPKRGLRFAANAAMPSRGVVGTVQHRADRLLELEPGPFLDDLDAIYRRGWSVPAS